MRYSMTEKTVLRLLSELEKAISDLPIIAPIEWLDFVILCCERTRDIRLFSAPPNCVNPELTQRIATVFNKAYKTINSLDLQKVSSDDGSQIQEYINNILQRADLFRQLTENAGKAERSVEVEEATN